MQPGASKRKGNAFENKMAKLLSAWMFGDKNVLGRHATSGAQKDVYVGDVIPAKITSFNWSTWPFIVELKTGYKDDIPDFYSQGLIHKWIDKMFDEATDMQHTPFLITQFYRKPPLLITTLQLDFWSDILMSHKKDDIVHIFYVYKFAELMDTCFKNIAPKELMTYLLEAPKHKNLRSTTYNKTQAKANTKGSNNLHVECSDILDQII